MKKCIMTWGLLVLAVMAKADAGFLTTLPAEDFATAGLQKLTPEELARLEALVQRYKTGEVAVVQKQAEAKVSVTQQEAEKKIVAAETKAKDAETKAKDAEAKADEAVMKSRAGETKAQEAMTKEVETTTAAVPAKKQPGWFTALITLNRAGEKPEKEEPLESRLAGDFRGWSGSTIFRLENGTRWVQQNKMDTYVYSPVLHSPKVKIKPAALNGFWLEIERVNLRVRVVPLDLTGHK